MTHEQKLEQLLTVAKLAYKEFDRVGEVFAGRMPAYFSDELAHVRQQLATAIAEASTVSLDK